MANNNLGAPKDLQDQVRNVATLIMGVFKDKKLTIDEMVDLSVKRLNQASVALLELKEAKKRDDSRNQE